MKIVLRSFDAATDMMVKLVNQKDRSMLVPVTARIFLTVDLHRLIEHFDTGATTNHS